MIFNFTATTRFYFFREPVDMRKGIHSLYHLVKTLGKKDALNGNAYVFVGSTRKSIKVLRWQKEGFVLYNKKLELGCYTLPQQVGDAPFFEVESTILDQIVNSIKHKSNSNELRLKVMITT
ncbi:IS66 family insertion sequence element accessory protein TnpB [Labilibaculum manganireducens]|uniref:IS66 family insertion sequence element accessory protein TnpB n=1 Tax=Labilibaculum manganireducens TaxID=1940525 RepID=UPI0029F4C8E2|nr:IS66 family insertion sequence element accessory protein TnpB [Labilibaculum manganireducens]